MCARENFIRPQDQNEEMSDRKWLWIIDPTTIVQEGEPKKEKPTRARRQEGQLFTTCAVHSLLKNQQTK